MTSASSRIRNLSSLLAAWLLCGACGGDRVVSGGTTSGAEAENAVAARVVGEDGKPVRGASVRARPSGSLTDSVWAGASTDSQGVVRLGLPKGIDWTLEVVSDTLAAQVVLASGQGPETIPEAVLRRRARLAGRVAGGVAGQEMRVAGLGRRAVLDGDLGFSFADLPEGRVTLRLGQAVWKVSVVAGCISRVSLDTAKGGTLSGDPSKSLVHAGQLLPSTGPDALIALEFTLPGSFARAVSRLRLATSDSMAIPLPTYVSGWDSVARRVRVWTRTPPDFRGGSLSLTLDTSGGASAAANPFQGRGMATTVFFSQPPGKSGTLDSWPNLSQTGRNLAATSNVSWQADPSDPMGGGIVAADRTEMLQLGGGLVGADLSMVSVRIRFLTGWQGWARILQVSDSAGATLVQLVRSGDTLMVVDGSSTTRAVVRQDTLWHTYTWSRTASSWRMRFDSQHLVEKADPSPKPGGLTFAEGGGMRMSQLMLWADTTVREPVPAGGIQSIRVLEPVR